MTLPLFDEKLKGLRAFTPFQVTTVRSDFDAASPRDLDEMVPYLLPDDTRGEVARAVLEIFRDAFYYQADRTEADRLGPEEVGLMERVAFIRVPDSDARPSTAFEDALTIEIPAPGARLAAVIGAFMHWSYIQMLNKRPQARTDDRWEWLAVLEYEAANDYYRVNGRGAGWISLLRAAPGHLYTLTEDARPPGIGKWVVVPPPDHAKMIDMARARPVVRGRRIRSDSKAKVFDTLAVGEEHAIFMDARSASVIHNRFQRWKQRSFLPFASIRVTPAPDFGDGWWHVERVR